MWTDPIVDEVHQARAALLKRFDGNFGALCAYLREQQQARLSAQADTKELRARDIGVAPNKH